VLGSDDLILEHRLLLERGTRAVALIGSCAPEETSATLHRLACVADGRVIPFVLRAGAWCGFAANAWAIDLLRWAGEVAPRSQLDRIIGLLCGYSSPSIARFDELGGLCCIGA
jgi:hypothetical protein